MTAKYFRNLCLVRCINIWKNHVFIRMAIHCNWLILSFVSEDAWETLRLAALPKKKNFWKGRIKFWGDRKTDPGEQKLIYWEWVKPKAIASRRCLTCILYLTKNLGFIVLFGINFRGFSKIQNFEYSSFRG